VKLSESEIMAQVEWADVILHHQRPWPLRIQKPAGIMYHAQPGGYRPGQTHGQFNGKKLVIAQYHARFYTDAEVVPNMIDIWAPAYQPAPKHPDRTVIFMGVASETSSGWGKKNSVGVQAIFQKIQKKHKDRVEIRFLKGRPMAEVFRRKPDADLVVDECQTGSYHLSSMEGLAYGAVVFNNIDDLCVQAIERVTGQPGHAFVKTGMDTLYDRLDHFIVHQEEMKARQKRSRKWIETHWDPKVRVQQFIRFFEKLS